MAKQTILNKKADAARMDYAMRKWFRFHSPIPAEPQSLELSPLAVPDDDVSFSSLSLTPFGFETWERFPAIAVEAVKKLLSRFYVLTAVHAFPTNARKKPAFYPPRSMEEDFLHTYVEILRLHGLGDHVYYQAPGDVITATIGADIPLSAMIFSGNYGPALDYHAYGFTMRPVADNMAQVRRFMDTAPHMLRLEFTRYPDTLEIHVNTEFLSQCLSSIRDVCAAASIPLEIDPALESLSEIDGA